MRLKSLHISLEEYGVNKGKYTGSAEFSGQYGDMKVTLSPEMSGEVLKICASALVDNAKDVATLMTSQVIEQAGGARIEDKS